MRLVHAFKIYRPEIEGGIPEVIGLLAQERGIDHHILVARRFGWGRTLVVNGVPVTAVTSLGTAFSMPIAPTFPLALRRQALGVDMIGLHVPFPLNDVGVMLGLPSNVGLMVHWHSEIVGRPLLRALLAPIIRNTLARADRILVSDASAVSSSPFLQPHAAKCAVVPFGVDPDYWSNLSASESAEVASLRRNHPRMIIAAGRLVAYKGFDVLVRALRDVDATAVIVGEGPQRGMLDRLAAQNGVTARLKLLGALPRPRLKLLLHVAQVFAFPSVTSAETFGIAQLEAMAVGLPIVNTALPTGVPRVARHGCEAVTVPPKDPSSLATALNGLLGDADLRSKLGSSGRERVRQEFHHGNFVRRTRAVYEEVYEGKRG